MLLKGDLLCPFKFYVVCGNDRDFIRLGTWWRSVWCLFSRHLGRFKSARFCLWSGAVGWEKICLPWQLAIVLSWENIFYSFRRLYVFFFLNTFNSGSLFSRSLLPTLLEIWLFFWTFVTFDHISCTVTFWGSFKPLYRKLAVDNVVFESVALPVFYNARQNIRFFSFLDTYRYIFGNLHWILLTYIAYMLL